MTVSIIIAVKTWGAHLEECVAKCLQLDYSDFEVIVLPDEPSEKKAPAAVRAIPTGAVSPAKKRDIGMSQAKGEILAFIDDDAYPRNDWLKNAVENFVDPEVAAVGGPAVTAPEDNLMQKASGAIYASAFVSAGYVYRYLPKIKRAVSDYPTVNLLVRKGILRELGGFNTDFWPGEDTKLCLEITKKLGKKIIYDPQVLVWHHRRPLFLAHLKQVASYALHRGYFVKKYPGTSLKPAYFLPSLFTAGLFLGGILSLLSAPLRQVYFFCLAVYLLTTLFFSLGRPARLVIAVFPGIVLTHIAYGVYFIKGIFSMALTEEKQGKR